MAGRRKHPEDDLQRLLVREHFPAILAPDLPWWHTPSGAKIPRTQAAILRGLGWYGGIHDLAWCPLVTIEMKAPGAPLKPSAAQEAFGERVAAWGGHWSVQNSVEGVYEFLTEHLPPGAVRGRLMA